MSTQATYKETFCTIAQVSINSMNCESLTVPQSRSSKPPQCLNSFWLICIVTHYHAYSRWPNKRGKYNQENLKMFNSEIARVFGEDCYVLFKCPSQICQKFIWNSLTNHLDVMELPGQNKNTRIDRRNIHDYTEAASTQHKWRVLWKAALSVPQSASASDDDSF